MPLGPQYTGSRISRDAVEDEDSDDPFAKYGADEGSDEDDGNDSEDDEAFDIDDKDSDEEMGDSQEDASSNDDADETDASDNDETDASEESEEDEADKTAKLREMMRDTTLVASALSKATELDIEKGKAIKTQRKTFDTLLNSRVRLQKALVSTNSMAAEPHASASAPPTAIEAAEAAALTLLNNLTDLRSTLEARTGEKRKRSSPFTSSTPSSEILSHITKAETSALPHRNAILEKWSQKTRNAALSSSKGHLNSTARQTLTDVLSQQLSDPTRLIAKTRVPRSCAPLQSAASLSTSEHIFDDADFYGLLLKELLENRSTELSANGSASEFVVQAPWQLAREAKTKKIVDTRASKGRKLRYTVHEKLQNFMAPEERGEWGERQRDELFGSLFGRRVGLGEDDEDVVSEDEVVDAEEEGLKLFRNV